MTMEIVLYTYHFNWVDCIWWLIPLTLSGIFIIASIGIWKSRQPSFVWKIARLFIPVMALLCVGITIVWIGLSIFAYRAVKTQIANREYTEVTGAAEIFSPMPGGGHAQERFYIDGTSFSYSTFDIQPGYHCASSWGGVVTHEGQFLKIQYIGAGDDKMITYIAEIA